MWIQQVHRLVNDCHSQKLSYLPHGLKAVSHMDKHNKIKLCFGQIMNIPEISFHRGPFNALNPEVRAVHQLAYFPLPLDTNANQPTRVGDLYVKQWKNIVMPTDCQNGMHETEDASELSKNVLTKWSCTPIARFMGPTWGPPGTDGPMWAPCGPREPCYLG